MDTETKIFKRCPMCGLQWNTRIDLMSDPDVEINGYLVNFNNLELGIFIFNHMSCRGTFTINASFFTDLYKGEIFDQNLTGSEKCPEYCLYKFELKRCPERCECAYVRDVIQLVKNYPKKLSSAQV